MVVFLLPNHFLSTICSIFIPSYMLTFLCSYHHPIRSEILPDQVKSESGCRLCYGFTCCSTVYNTYETCVTSDGVRNLLGSNNGVVD
uniref:Uncharacterized protein n=1 Tax=Aegilops tauschii subsp. strangulata TaxID=200361 RepID=A0A453A6W9_AEGTS